MPLAHKRRRLDLVTGLFDSRSTGSRSILNQDRLREPLIRKLTGSLQEQTIDQNFLKTCNKAFSCAWLDNNTVAIGTKDERVIALNADTLQPKAEVSLPSVLEFADPLDYTKVCGVRGLAANPSKDLLAASGAGPDECAILSLPDFQIVQRLAGHSDWVFGSTWLTDRHIVTASRDQTIKLWELNIFDGCQLFKRHQRLSRKPGQGRVRDVKWSHSRQELASMGTDAVVGFWDASLNLKHEVKLPEEDELACMAVDEASDGSGCVAVGSLNIVALVDPRGSDPIVAIPNTDGHFGVRSLQFEQGLLTIGTGFSHLHFFDMRTRRFLPVSQSAASDQVPTGAGKDHGNGKDHQKLVASRGWLERNQTYWDYFQNVDVHTAIYAHEWDPGRTRIFSCGGPLATGLNGSYIGMWR